MVVWFLVSRWKLVVLGVVGGCVVRNVKCLLSSQNNRLNEQTCEKGFRLGVTGDVNSVTKSP